MTSHFPEFFPGSRHPIPRNTVKATPQGLQESTWDAKPLRYKVGGVEKEFFTIGQLAEALNRKAVSIRRWEKEGIIPKPSFNKPSNDPRGRRRLYTREQVEGVVQIAKDEGIWDNTYAAIPKRFTERVVLLFKELAKHA